MCTILKAMCLPGLKRRITLPTDWLQQTEDHLLFTYFIDDQIRFLEVPKDEDGADFLLENGFIESYKGSGKNLRMFVTQPFMVAGKKGERLRWVRTSVVGWDQIKFFPSDAVHIAAKNEYDLTGSLMGLAVSKTKAKLRSLNTHQIQAA